MQKYDDITECAIEAYQRIELMDQYAQREVFKDERFVQWILYEEFRRKFDGNKVDMEFQAQALQGGGGGPRALDFAIFPFGKERKIFAIELKLAANWGDTAKKQAIASDLTRLAYLLQKRAALKCYFIMFGLKADIQGVSYPGFSRKDQKYLKEAKYRETTVSIQDDTYLKKLERTFQVDSVLDICVTNTGVKVWTVSLVD